jgi:hypothetical protein
MSEEKPYEVDEKSLEKLQEWLDAQGEDASFRAEKIKRHRKGESTWIPVGDVYYGDASFSEHPWTHEKCMTFGRGLDGRMWTSPVLSAEEHPEEKGVWLIKTYNSIYRLELNTKNQS